jgi:hypothetical protein
LKGAAFDGDANPRIATLFKALSMADLLPNLSQFGPIRGAIALCGHQYFRLMS